MKRALWVPPIAAIAAVVLLPMGNLVALAAAAVGAVWAAWFGPPVAVLALPFVLVEVLGEGFQVGAPVGVVILSYGLVAIAAAHAMARRWPGAPGRIDRAVAAWFLVVAVYTVFGATAGWRSADIKEDLVPIVVFGVTYVATRLLARGSRAAGLLLAIVVAGTVPAACKVAYLFVDHVPIGWDTQWQAMRVEGAGTMRIVLRGADVFFIVCSLLVFAKVVAGRTVRLPEALAGLICTACVVVAGTRSNWAGWAVGASVIVIVGVAARLAHPRRAALLMTAAGGAAVVLVAAIPAVGRWMLTLASASVSRTYTVGFRANETDGILRALAADGWLGGGFGRLYTFWNLDALGLTTTAWSHNAYLQILLKTGPIGLAAFLFAVGLAVAVALGRCLEKSEDRARSLGLAAAVIAVLVVSLTSNKVFVLSGGMFLGMALALVEGDGDERTR